MFFLVLFFFLILYWTLEPLKLLTESRTTLLSGRDTNFQLNSNSFFHLHLYGLFFQTRYHIIFTPLKVNSLSGKAFNRVCKM